MEISVVLLIFVLTFSYGSTGPEILDDELGDSLSYVEVVKRDEEGRRYGEADDGVKKHLIAKDYYRIDSGDSDDHVKLQGSADNLQKLDPNEIEQIKAEIAAGDPSQVFGTNTHFQQPSQFVDLGRRFVLQYPYKEHIVSKSNPENDDNVDNSLIPVKAPPELVLAVAKKSAAFETTKPVNPTDELIKKDILRTGNYWNSYWKEEGDPEKLLRMKRNKMKSVNAKLTPGTEIYDVVSKLQLQQPKLLYIMNKRDTN